MLFREINVYHRRETRSRRDPHSQTPKTIFFLLRGSSDFHFPPIERLDLSFELCFETLANWITPAVCYVRTCCIYIYIALPVKGHFGGKIRATLKKRVSFSLSTILSLREGKGSRNLLITSQAI